MLKFYNRQRIKPNIKLPHGPINDKKYHVSEVEGFGNVNEEPSLEIKYIN